MKQKQKGDKGIEKIEEEEKLLALMMKCVDFLIDQRKEKGKWKQVKRKKL
jgi:hypothetical protein